MIMYHQVKKQRVKPFNKKHQNYSLIFTLLERNTTSYSLSGTINKILNLTSYIFNVLYYKGFILYKKLQIIY